MKVQPIYNSKIFKKGLEFAADKSALFVASTSFVLSTIARPVAIMSTPKTDKENKKYACAKSLASSAAGYVLMLGASLPVSSALSKIDKSPTKYLKKSTIEAFKHGEKTLSKSSRFAFAKQLFNLGLGFLIVLPKTALTCALIPPIMSKIFPKKQEKSKEISFTGGIDKLSKSIGKLMDTSVVKKLANKFHNKNYEPKIMYLTDTFATGAFIVQTAKSKKIEEDRKKALMYNAGISTGLCIGGTYAISNLLKKSTDKFIINFKKANKNSPKLDKYIEGIRIAKPALIMGGIYYIAIPLISTFLADRCDKKA